MDTATIPMNDHGGDMATLFAQEPLVVFDGDCIFCANYVKMFRARQSLGEFKLFNARELPEPTLSEIQAAYDLDEGMLFVAGGKVHYGDDAVHALALVTSGAGWFNKIIGAVFRSRRASSLLYPLLKAGRRVVLALRGKKLIARDRSS